MGMLGRNASEGDAMRLKVMLWRSKKTPDRISWSVLDRSAMNSVNQCARDLSGKALYSRLRPQRYRSWSNARSSGRPSPAAARWFAAGTRSTVPNGASLLFDGIGARLIFSSANTTSGGLIFVRRRVAILRCSRDPHSQ